MLFSFCPAVIIYWVGKVILGKQLSAALENTTLLKTGVTAVYLMLKKKKEKIRKGRMEMYILEKVLKKKFENPRLLTGWQYAFIVIMVANCFKTDTILYIYL